MNRTVAGNAGTEAPIYSAAQRAYIRYQNWGLGHVGPRTPTIDQPIRPQDPFRHTLGDYILSARRPKALALIWRSEKMTVVG